MRRGNIKNKRENDSAIKNIDGEIKIEENSKLGLENLKGNKKPIIKNRVKITILVIICIILVLITISLLLYKYKDNIFKVEDIIGTNIQNINKTESKDASYLVQFTDKYTYNPITIKTVEYKEGTIKVDGENQDKVYVSYVQIEGLLDTKIQEKINKEIKDEAFSLNKNLTNKQQYSGYAYVEGNFANILSIQVCSYVYESNEAVKEKETFLNYNLATGEKIKFLDLFADNTPMNSIIYDLKYEELAWDTEIDFDMSEKELDNATNMDKRDTSEYEDIILEAINRYKKLDKDKIEFYVTPNRIVVNLGINEGGEVGNYAIDLYKYHQYVTLFKKFLTDKVIYESIPKVEAFVFNDYLGYTPEYYQTDNLFLCMLDDSPFEYEQELEKEEVEKYSSEAVSTKKKLEKEFKQKIADKVKTIASENTKKGYIARFVPFSNIYEYSNDYGKDALICISFYGELEEMSKEYFSLNAFKLLAKQNSSPKVSIDDALVGALDYNNKNIKSILYDKNYKPIFSLEAYYTLDGKLVADTYEGVEEYIDNKYKQTEQQVEIYREENI